MRLQPFARAWARGVLQRELRTREEKEREIEKEAPGPCAISQN